MNQSDRARERVMAFTGARNKCRSELEKVTALKSGLYADYQQNLLIEKEYLSLNEEYSKRMEALEQQIRELSDAVEGFSHTLICGTGLKEAIQKYRSKRKLSKEMVGELVEKVIVHADKKREVVFCYDDEMKKLAAAMEQWKEELA